MPLFVTFHAKDNGHNITFSYEELQCYWIKKKIHYISNENVTTHSYTDGHSIANQKVLVTYQKYHFLP